MSSDFLMLCLQLLMSSDHLCKKLRKRKYEVVIHWNSTYKGLQMSFQKSFKPVLQSVRRRIWEPTAFSIIISKSMQFEVANFEIILRMTEIEIWVLLLRGRFSGENDWNFIVYNMSRMDSFYDTFMMLLSFLKHDSKYQCPLSLREKEYLLYV